MSFEFVVEGDACLHTEGHDDVTGENHQGHWGKLTSRLSHQRTNPDHSDYQEIYYNWFN